MVTPVRDGRNTLPNLLDSLLKQNLPEPGLLWVVVDDGSSDGTSEWLSSIQGNLPFALRHFRIPGTGPGGARNAGIASAHAPWITFVDADDTLEPDALECWLRVASQSESDLLILDQPTSITGRMRARLGEEPRSISAAQVWDGESLRAWTVHGKMVSRRLLDKRQVAFGDSQEAEDLVFFARAITRAHGIRYEPGLPKYIYGPPATSAMASAPQGLLGTLHSYYTALSELQMFAPNRESFLQGASSIIGSVGATIARGLAFADDVAGTAIQGEGTRIFEMLDFGVRELARLCPRDRAAAAFGLACTASPGFIGRYMSKTWVSYKRRSMAADL